MNRCSMKKIYLIILILLFAAPALSADWCILIIEDIGIYPSPVDPEAITEPEQALIDEIRPNVPMNVYAVNGAGLALLLYTLVFTIRRIKYERYFSRDRSGLFFLPNRS